MIDDIIGNLYVRLMFYFRTHLRIVYRVYCLFIMVSCLILGYSLITNGEYGRMISQDNQRILLGALIMQLGVSKL